MILTPGFITAVTIAKSRPIQLVITLNTDRAKEIQSKGQIGKNKNKTANHGKMKHTEVLKVKIFGKVLNNDHLTCCR